MNIGALASTAHARVANGKGLVAIDESIGTGNKRFSIQDHYNREMYWGEQLSAVKKQFDKIRHFSQSRNT